MAGLVIDIVLAYMFRSLVRTFHFVKSFRWSRVDGITSESTVLDPYLGCPSVKIRYRISTDASQQWWDEVPFYLIGSARIYAKKLRPNMGVTIRVNPNNPRKTFYFPYDQARSSAAANTRFGISAIRFVKCSQPTPPHTRGSRQTSDLTTPRVYHFSPPCNLTSCGFDSQPVNL